MGGPIGGYAEGLQMEKMMTTIQLEDLRPSVLAAIYTHADPEADNDLRKVVAVQFATLMGDEDIATYNAPAAPEADTMQPAGAFGAWENLGMQWVVLGMAPGIDFLVATDTRREAVEYLADYDGKTFDYFAIVKARDFFRLP